MLPYRGSREGRPPENRGMQQRNGEWLLKKITFGAVSKSRLGDSNPRPADYKSAALPTELRRLEALSKCIFTNVFPI